MHSPDQSPRMIFFDVGETLIRPRKPFGELLREVASATSVDLPEAAFDGLSTHIDGRVVESTQRGVAFTFPPEASQRFWFDTYNAFLKQFLTCPEADALTRAFLDLLSSPKGYELYPDTHATLDCLLRRGYRLGIISNWEAWLPTLLAALGIADSFDHILISGECGFEKPDQQIFTRALQESGYRPDEIVYVGDRPAHDVEPALVIGIRPILLDRNARYSYDNRYETISSLHDLILALDNSICNLSQQTRPAVQ